MPEVVELPKGLEERQTDLLLLLVGGNPLPNAVAGTLLAKDNATIALIHSPSTFGLAQRLGDVLCQGSERKSEFIQVDEADPGRIYQGVTGWLSGQGQTDSLGLNYTGGTKAMAVHAYTAVVDWAVKNQVPLALSYLDAHTLSLRFAPSPSAPAGPCTPVPVGPAVRVELSEMLGLHNWRLETNDPPHDTPQWPKTARKLAELVAGQKGWGEYQRWLQELAGSVQVDVHGFLSIPVPNHTALARFVSTWKEELGLDSSAEEVKLSKAGGREALRWLGGLWLESYVLAILRDLAETLGLHDCKRHVVPVDPTTGILFDLDVVAIRGYQLFAFSCGLAEKRARLKLKLLEVAIRARQVGGDEARAALVCVSDEPEDLEREVRQQLGNEAVRVFGRAHLENLEAEIQRWMEG